MKNLLCFLLLCFFVLSIDAQKPNTVAKDEISFSGLKLRNVGPAFTSGRIADIAIHPDNDNIWYVAVGSGGVWKTMNSGVTWKPIFDNQSVYSTGCITIDTHNPSTIWLGTGENVGGRHVAWGDGVYRSTDSGKTWKNMGLKKSEHISKIIVHPDHSEIIYVAAQGPLWNKGGERGLYKSIDGGNNWKKVLGNDEWVGVTDLIYDSRDPNTMYAATWQRHRTVAAYMGGGPGSGIHKSTDGGETWQKMTTGIPKSNLGKIGLAISPQNPDVVYAAIELDRTTGGVFRSTDRGVSWEKRSNTVSGATGPHYYQELVASPHQFDRLYLMDVRVQLSEDGGKTFTRLSENKKHSDNHSLTFRKDDPNYLLIGSDGGIYESFDLAKNWRFINNMPITQYYKLALDDAKPFYNIYGGTQDNGSHGGPSRTDNSSGIRNGDWFKILGADGHQTATETGNPKIVYAETQQGGLHRIDRMTGETVFIQPQAGAGEGFERFNWDAPILVSPHNPTRLYFASYRMWRSDDRGDSWTAISGDLTRNEERITLPIMGKRQSWDNAWDVGAMSNYNTITSISESPLQEGLLYAGTDDGIIQVSENGGTDWRKVMASSISGVPSTAFVNDIKADLHDVNTVYVCLDNHKYGDYKPYIIKSSDRGKTWTSISSNLKKGTLAWRLVQDHVKPSLLFIGTENGIYFSANSGIAWHKLSGGVPTISFRDLAIQKQHNDLVGASFGRSFYVLDDYSILRELSPTTKDEEAKLFSVRDALWYIPKSIVGSQGADKYLAKNPDFGAVFTYHLGKGYTDQKSERKKKEKSLSKSNQDIPFPGWDALAKEKMAEKTKIWLTVKDASGAVVRKIEGKTGKGFHRIAWDLRHASKRTVSMNAGQRGRSRWSPRGALAPPGTYSVVLSKQEDGKVTALSAPVTFEVVPLRDGALPAADPSELVAFNTAVNKVQNEWNAVNYTFNECKKKARAIKTSIARADVEPGMVDEKVHKLFSDISLLDIEINGNPAKREIGERDGPTVGNRLSVARRGAFTTYGPTPTHKMCLDIAEDGVKKIAEKVKAIAMERIPEIEQLMKNIGAPMIEGQVSPEKW